MDKLTVSIGIFLAVIVGLFLRVLVLSIPVAMLWNWVIPDIFALPSITYSQALGISLLCQLLFKDHGSDIE